jgi:WD40 repeat protein
LYIKMEKGGPQVRTLDGQLLRTLPKPKGGVWSMWLSPDEQTLLLEGWDGGFALLDLETNQMSDGPSHGHSAAWSPDGRTIAYLGRWQLWLYDVATGRSSLVASREPTVPERGSGYWEGPSWSTDGNMLAANIGGDYPSGSDQLDAPTLIIDLKRKTAMVFPDYIKQILWVPHPHPFHGE